jgi:hypothetical protein
MSDFEFELNGITNLKEEFADEIEDWSDSGSVYVGTAVEYSIYLEYGTSNMDPRPYFRPALAEAKEDLTAFIGDHTDTSVAAIETADKLVSTIALAIERRVKEIITEKGLIDTGTLRASISAVDTEGELLVANEVTV